MGQAFFTEMTGNPADARFRIAAEPDVTTSGALVDPPVPANLAASWQQFHANGGPFAITQEEIDDLVLSTSGKPQDALPGKRRIEASPFPLGTVDPSNPGQLMLLANLFGAYGVTDNTTYQVWRFDQDQSTAVVPRLTYQENGQIITPFRYSGLKALGYTAAASPSSPYELTVTVDAERYDMFGDVTQTVGSGSTLPVLIGTFAGNLVAEATDNDIYIEVQVDNGGGSYDFRVKVGAGAAYSNVQTHTVGSWLRLLDESGVRIGDFRDQVRAFLPSGATLTATDVFKIPRRHVGWSESLGTRTPISSVNTIFVVDGTEIRVEGGWGVEVAWSDVQAEDDTSGAQGRTIIRAGELRPTINLTRKVRDLLFQKGIHEGSEVAVVIDALTDATISSSGRPYRFLQVFPRCLVTGSMHRVEAGGGNRDEAPVLQVKNPAAGYNYGGYSFTAPSNVLIENGVADIASLAA